MAENSRPAWMETVEKMIHEVAARENCLVYDVEFVGAGKHRTLRIFIDKEDGNVSIDDCSNVSKGLNELLDADENLIPGGAYNLEVSTPGLERHLKTPWHFQKVVGKKILIKTSKSLESAGVTDKRLKSAKTVEEVLAGADDNGIRFQIKDEEVTIPYAMIEKAKVVFEMTKGQKK